MKRLLTLAMVCMLVMVAARAARADDPVQPQTLNGVALYRDTTGYNYTTNTHYTRGASLLMTNMACYATADLGSNSVIQPLTGVTVEVAMSTSYSATGTWYAATVQTATNGTWGVSLQEIPDASTVYWQTRLTDAATNVYYYQIQMLYADPHL